MTIHIDPNIIIAAATGAVVALLTVVAFWIYAVWHI